MKSELFEDLLYDLGAVSEETHGGKIIDDELGDPET